MRMMMRTDRVFTTRRGSSRLCCHPWPEMETHGTDIRRAKKGRKLSPWCMKIWGGGGWCGLVRTLRCLPGQPTAAGYG